MVAICLQTCDRYELTLRTLSSLAEHNDLSKFRLLHADDCSQDDRIGPLVRDYGFTTVVQTKKRRGIANVRAQLIEAAAGHKDRWVLLLENDILSVRPFPWDLFRYVTTKRYVYCLRLYGRFKGLEHTDPCLTRHKRTGLRVDWRPFTPGPEASQVGLIHWSPQPAVTRTKDLLRLHRHGHESDALTVRVKRNVMAHIGYERTPGRML